MKVIHTVGLGNRSLEVLLELLRAAGARCVVDVRRYGSSARYPHHEAEFLHRELRREGFEVCDLGPLLGGDRRGGYSRYMDSPSFRHGMRRLQEIADVTPTVLVCAEREPDRCHRRHVSDDLEARGWSVRHHVQAPSERTGGTHLRLVRRTG